MKKFIVALLAIVVVATMFPLSAKAESSWLDKYGINLSAEDIELIAQCVTLEQGGDGYESQLASAQVILNRLIGMGSFSSVSGVIYAEGQFDVAPDMWSRETSSSCRDAVMEIIAISDESLLPLPVYAYMFRAGTPHTQASAGDQVTLVAQFGTTYYSYRAGDKTQHDNGWGKWGSY